MKLANVVRARGHGACSQPGGCSRLATCEAGRGRDAAWWHGDPCATTNACFESGRVPTRPIGRSRSRLAPQFPLRAYAKACEWHAANLPSSRRLSTGPRSSLVSRGDRSPPVHRPSMGTELTTNSAPRARVLRVLPRDSQAPTQAQMRLHRCASWFRGGGRSWHATTRPHAEGDELLPVHRPSMGSKPTTTSAARARVLPKPPSSLRAQAPAQAQMRLRRSARLAVEAAPGTTRHGRTRKATSLLPVTRHSTGLTPTTTSAKQAHVLRFLSLDRASPSACASADAKGS